MESMGSSAYNRHPICIYASIAVIAPAKMLLLLLLSLLLLAPQSGAHRRGAFRDPIQPIPSHPLLAFEHLSLYIQKHLSVSSISRPLVD